MSDQPVQLRVGLAQIDTRVGDLEGNAQLVEEWTAKAADQGAHVVVFPEMTLTGYPPEDLVLRESFARASERAVVDLAAALDRQGHGDIGVVVGYLAHTEGGGPAPIDSMPTDADDHPSDANPRRGAPRNAAALLYGGEVVARYYKRHLPNYGVFDEDRYFVSGNELPIVRLHGLDIAMVICEDLWVEGGPAGVAGQAGVDLVLSPNASPYERAKDDARLPLVRRRAAEAHAPVVYCNQVGGQDELVFDGDSMVVAADGELLARAPQFVEHLLTVDLSFDRTTAERRDGRIGPMTVTRRVVSEEPVAPFEARPAHLAKPLTDCEEVWRALTLGLKDFIDKNDLPSVVLGLSGGIDSAVVAALAADALGADRVYGVGLPSKYSSEGSLTDAEDLAKRLGLHYDVIPIAPIVEAFEKTIELSGTAAENLQARVRGTLLMGLSNQHGHLLLATSNKSEVAVGYSTLYGDAAGGYAPIKDVPKTLVWELARWRNEYARERGEAEPIPQSSIDKPPSAELAPGQKDTDSLPSYDELDAVVADYVDRDLGMAQLLERGHDPDVVARVLRLVDMAEFKRRQSAPGTKISLKAFGRDRRLPITNRWRESLPSVREGAAQQS